MAKVKMCKYCKENKNREVYFSTLDDNVYICPKCKHELIDTIMYEEEHWVLCDISSDTDFVEVMIDLKQNNLIEYQLKMSQFKNQVVQQKQAQTTNIPHCPICNSTNLSKITSTRKAVKIAAFGIFGMGDNGKTWKCIDCGSKF